MSKGYLENYMRMLQNFNDKDYLLSTVIYSISPTIAGEKVSSLVTFNRKGKRDLYDLWIRYKDEVSSEIDLDYFELKKTEDICVVIFYNNNQLKEILLNEKNQRFLKKFNYKSFDSVTEYLKMLKSRYENLCPHEIGIFLGYPLEDVIDFVECPNKQCLLIGYWKVYNDIKNAKMKFNRYNSIKDKVVDFIVKGYNPKAIISYI